MATAEDKNYRLIRVTYGVLSITNKAVMVRTDLKECPDGFYRITTALENDKRVINGVLDAENSAVIGTYPDVDRVMPNLKNLAFQTIMAQAQVAYFMAFCQEVAAIKGTVVIESRYAYCMQNKDISFGFDFNTPVPINCNAFFLLQAVREVSKYPSIYITREVATNEKGERNMPLILGNGWRNCSMCATILY